LSEALTIVAHPPVSAVAAVQSLLHHHSGNAIALAEIRTSAVSDRATGDVDAKGCIDIEHNSFGIYSVPNHSDLALDAARLLDHAHPSLRGG